MLDGWRSTTREKWNGFRGWGYKIICRDICVEEEEIVCNNSRQVLELKSLSPSEAELCGFFLENWDLQHEQTNYSKPQTAQHKLALSLSAETGDNTRKVNL